MRTLFSKNSNLRYAPVNYIDEYFGDCGTTWMVCDTNDSILYSRRPTEEGSESSEHKIIIKIKDSTKNQNNIGEITQRGTLESP